MKNFERYLTQRLMEAAKFGAGVPHYAKGTSTPLSDEGGGEENPKRTPKTRLHPDRRTPGQRAREAGGRGGRGYNRRSMSGIDITKAWTSQRERELQANVTPAQRVNIARKEKGMPETDADQSGTAKKPEFGAGVPRSQPTLPYPSQRTLDADKESRGSREGSSLEGQVADIGNQYDPQGRSAAAAASLLRGPRSAYLLQEDGLQVKKEGLGQGMYGAGRLMRVSNNF